MRVCAVLSSLCAVAVLSVSGATPDEVLIAAVERGNEARVSAALAKGASVHACARTGESAIVLAGLRGRTMIARLLASKGARLNVPDQSGMTPLMAAARRNHLETYRALVNLGASPSVTGPGGATVLHCAVESGGTAMVSEVLQSRAVDIDGRGEDGNTALMIAAALDHADIVKALLGANAMVNALNPREYNSNALLRALRERYRRESASAQPAAGDTAAARPGPGTAGPVRQGPAMGILPGSHGRTILLLLQGGTDLDHVTKDGCTALILAVEHGDLPLLELLLAERLDVNLPGARGETALIAAVKTGRAAVVEMLLNAGANVQVKSGEGADAIDYAQKMDRKDLVKLLREGRRKAR